MRPERLAGQTIFNNYLLIILIQIVMKNDQIQSQLYFLASTSFENKDYQEAEMYYKCLIDLDPTEYSYQSQYSFALRLQGKLDKALCAVDAAISLNPQDVDLYWMKAAA